jgi:hypothetical protein
MALYVHLENSADYRKARIEQRHAMLLKLLAAELARDKPPPTCSKGY